MQSENILDANDDFFSSWVCFWPNVNYELLYYLDSTIALLLLCTQVQSS